MLLDPADKSEHTTWTGPGAAKSQFLAMRAKYVMMWVPPTITAPKLLLLNWLIRIACWRYGEPFTSEN